VAEYTQGPEQGKLVAVGTSGIDSASSILLARFNPDGSLDHSFGTDGTAVAQLDGSPSYASAVSLAPDGGILVLASSPLANSPQVIARFHGGWEPR